MPSFVICSTSGADTAHEFEISAERLAELLGDEELDLDNPDHRTLIENEFWESGPDMPSICAQCSGWGSDHELSIGDEWEVTDILERD